ncbi:MAG: hypothetical protein OEO79_13630 [Gemmatimonadota bacterium]|nr:hypothetical protein [Gemmatimonadota bacterium]
MSGKDIRETVGLLAVVAGLVFVGLEIRQGTIASQAAAYQAIGIATSEWHQYIDRRMDRLFTEASYPEAIERWTLGDWESYSRATTADLRMFETIHLQTDQGLLPADAIDRLGYAWGPILSVPAFACLWPRLSQGVGESARIAIEAMTPDEDRFQCHVDLQALTDETVLEGLAG